MYVNLETSHDVASLNEYIHGAIKFLKLYTFMADAFVVDFFVNDHWSRLPASWQQALDSWSGQQLADFMTDTVPGTPESASDSPQMVPPLSLLCYGACCRALSLCRRPVPSPQPVADFLRRVRTRCRTGHSGDYFASAPFNNTAAAYHCDGASPSRSPTNCRDASLSLRPTNCVDAVGLPPSLTHTNCGDALPSLTPTNCGDALPSLTSTNCGDALPSLTPTNCGDVLPSLTPTNCGDALPSLTPTNCGDALPSLTPTNCGDALPSLTPTNCGDALPSLTPTNCGDALPSLTPTNCGEAPPSLTSTECSDTVSSVFPADVWPVNASAELTPGGGQLKLLDHVFRRHVKPKKQHELRRLARLVELTAPKLVVDMGSGRGHLSRYLAYRARLPVVCLESNVDFVSGARKLDDQLEQVMQKRPDFVLPARPLHAACHITADIDQQEFVEMLARLTAVPPSALRFAAVGLHTCGDLAAVMLRQFVESPQCSAVVSVGCCYMKLSTSADGSPAWCGYPLSRHVARAARHAQYTMSYEAREVACHAIEEYATRLRLGGEQHLKIHTLRAALERALVQHDPALRHLGLRGVKRAHTISFRQYAVRALERAPVDVDRLDLSSAPADLNQWRRVVAFYSLRLMLAPVIESVVLADRLLYLADHGHDCMLVAAFDPRLSPRNFVIVSSKR